MFQDVHALKTLLKQTNDDYIMNDGCNQTKHVTTPLHTGTHATHGTHTDTLSLPPSPSLAPFQAVASPSVTKKKTTCTTETEIIIETGKTVFTGVSDKDFKDLNHRCLWQVPVQFRDFFST